MNWVLKFRKAFLKAHAQYLEQNEIEKAILNSQDNKIGHFGGQPSLKSPDSTIELLPEQLLEN